MTRTHPTPSPRDVLDEAWRAHWARLVGLLIGQFARPDLAEDAVAEAFAAAARTWDRGVPDSPAAWLLTAARRTVLDRLRTEAVHARKQPLMLVDARTRSLAAEVTDPGAHIADERLRLIFTCCHPALTLEARVALTLRFVVGLDVAEIARLLVVRPTTMAARVTRAKRRLASSGIPFDVPEPERLAERLDAVATVTYLVFTSGYQPTGRGEPIRFELAHEAIRLARLLDQLLPGQAVVRALLALMVLQHSRRAARLDTEGRLVLLPDQDRGLWRTDEVEEGVALLGSLPATSGSTLAQEYRLQALIAAEHATAPSADATRWPRVVEAYQRLEELTGSPLVRLARAVAVAEASGPHAGLVVLDGIETELPDHHRAWAVRAELLLRSGRPEEADVAYERALDLVANDAERAHLTARRARGTRGTMAPGTTRHPTCDQLAGDLAFDRR